MPKPVRKFAARTPEAIFGRVLRETRDRKALTQEALGFESGFHRTYISFLERGLKSPSLGTILSLATALDASAGDMVRRVERALGDTWKQPRRSRR